MDSSSTSTGSIFRALARRLDILERAITQSLALHDGQSGTPSALIISRPNTAIAKNTQRLKRKDDEEPAWILAGTTPGIGQLGKIADRTSRKRKIVGFGTKGRSAVREGFVGKWGSTGLDSPDLDSQQQRQTKGEDGKRAGEDDDTRFLLDVGTGTTTIIPSTENEHTDDDNANSDVLMREITWTGSILGNYNSTHDIDDITSFRNPEFRALPVTANKTRLPIRISVAIQTVLETAAQLLPNINSNNIPSPGSDFLTDQEGRRDTPKSRRSLSLFESCISKLGVESASELLCSSTAVIECCCGNGAADCRCRSTSSLMSTFLELLGEVPCLAELIESDIKPSPTVAASVSGASWSKSNLHNHGDRQQHDRAYEIDRNEGGRMCVIAIICAFAISRIVRAIELDSCVGSQGGYITPPLPRSITHNIDINLISEVITHLFWGLSNISPEFGHSIIRHVVLLHLHARGPDGKPIPETARTHLSPDNPSVLSFLATALSRGPPTFLSQDTKNDRGQITRRNHGLTLKGLVTIFQDGLLFSPLIGVTPSTSIWSALLTIASGNLSKELGPDLIRPAMAVLGSLIRIYQEYPEFHKMLSRTILILTALTVQRSWSQSDSRLNTSLLDLHTCLQDISQHYLSHTRNREISNKHDLDSAIIASQAILSTAANISTTLVHSNGVINPRQSPITSTPVLAHALGILLYLIALPESRKQHNLSPSHHSSADNHLARRHVYGLIRSGLFDCLLSDMESNLTGSILHLDTRPNDLILRTRVLGILSHQFEQMNISPTPNLHPGVITSSISVHALPLLSSLTQDILSPSPSSPLSIHKLTCTTILSNLRNQITECRRQEKDISHRDGIMAFYSGLADPLSLPSRSSFYSSSSSSSNSSHRDINPHIPSKLNKKQHYQGQGQGQESTGNPDSWWRLKRKRSRLSQSPSLTTDVDIDHPPSKRIHTGMVTDKRSSKISASVSNRITDDDGYFSASSSASSSFSYRRSSSSLVYRTKSRTESASTSCDSSSECQHGTGFTSPTIISSVAIATLPDEGVHIRASSASQKQNRKRGRGREAGCPTDASISASTSSLPLKSSRPIGRESLMDIMGLGIGNPDFDSE